MNVGALGDVIEKAGHGIAKGAASVSGWAGGAAKTGANVFESAIERADKSITASLYGKLGPNHIAAADRLGAAAGGGIYGATLGAAGGGLIGGIAGGIDEDETFIGGALKGTAIGAGIGALGGAAQGAIRKDSGIIGTAAKDLKYAKAAASRGLGKDGGVLK